jgi:ribosomal protein S27AE
MRVWYPRYARDLQRLHLAQRLIAHRARTQVISDWTGLSVVQIRSLYRQFGKESNGGDVQRLRGPGPTSVTQLLTSERWRSEAAGFIGLCYVLAAMPSMPIHDPKRELRTVARGERLCRAFEIYRTLMPGRSMTFHQALLLYTAVAMGQEVQAAKCGSCGAVIVRDVLGIGRWNCGRCTRIAADEPRCLTGFRVPNASRNTKPVG